MQARTWRACLRIPQRQFVSAPWNAEARNSIVNPDNPAGSRLWQVQQGFYFLRRRITRVEGFVPEVTLFLEPVAARSKSVVPAGTAFGTGNVWLIQDRPWVLAAGTIMVSANVRDRIIEVLSDLDGLLQLQVVECTVPDHMKGSAIAANWLRSGFVGSRWWL